MINMGLRTLCSDLCGEVLDAVIPNRTKRLIMLSSLCPVVAEKKDLTNEYIAMLNSQLSLSREEDALKLPMAMSRSIWNGLPDEVHVVNEDPNHVAYRIMAAIPNWLRYDNDNVILDELRNLLWFNSVYHRDHMVHEITGRG